MQIKETLDNYIDYNAKCRYLETRGFLDLGEVYMKKSLIVYKNNLHVFTLDQMKIMNFLAVRGFELDEEGDEILLSNEIIDITLKDVMVCNYKTIKLMYNNLIKKFQSSNEIN